MSRELIRNVYNSFYKLRDRAERIASRAIDNAADLLIFGKELSALGSDTTPLPSWAALHLSTWGSLKQALKGLSVEFALLADRAAQQGKKEENDVVEKLNLFLDLLQSYKDLCERHEKGVLHKHQRALHKYGLMKRQMMSAAHGREPESVEQLESRIVELIPEKKGLFLKHVEYEVSSQRFKSSVYRRYNDFVVFHEVLLHKFPYRMVPALPPKRVLGADREFIEGRRRALKRFINLVARHPPFSEDVLLKLFLSFSGSDVQHKLKEAAQCVGDEFMNCKLAARAFVNSQIQGHKEMSKVWNDLKPKLSCLFAGPHSVLTPPRSPQEDGVCPH